MSRLIALAGTLVASVGMLAHAAPSAANCPLEHDVCSNGIDPPTVTNLDSVAGADWANPGPASVSYPLTQFLVSFSKPMATNGPGSVLLPTNWLVVSAGLNGVVDTTGCDQIGADDIRVDVNAISHDSGSNTTALPLAFGGGLVADNYQLFACASLADTNGNPLDGAGDGGSSEDFHRNLKVFVNPQLVNPNFDQGLFGWSTQGGSISPWVEATQDGENKPTSGSARVLGNDVAGVDGRWRISQCTHVSLTESHSFSAIVDRGVSHSLDVHSEIEWFDSIECNGALLGARYSESLPIPSTQFNLLEMRNIVPPPTAQSLRVTIQALGRIQDAVTVDRVLYPDTDPLFGADFEEPWPF